tara:strand:+ start:489 stop:1166 length:678 start_codon:yes stop_codon:yes gene_type:complete
VLAAGIGALKAFVDIRTCLTIATIALVTRAFEATGCIGTGRVFITISESLDTFIDIEAVETVACKSRVAHTVGTIRVGKAAGVGMTTSVVVISYDINGLVGGSVAVIVESIADIFFWHRCIAVGQAIARTGSLAIATSVEVLDGAGGGESKVRGRAGADTFLVHTDALLASITLCRGRFITEEALGAVRIVFTGCTTKRTNVPVIYTDVDVYSRGAARAVMTGKA